VACGDGVVMSRQPILLGTDKMVKIITDDDNDITAILLVTLSCDDFLVMVILTIHYDEGTLLFLLLVYSYHYSLFAY
jgi:hypothetical protein